MALSPLERYIPPPLGTGRKTAVFKNSGKRKYTVLEVGAVNGERRYCGEAVLGEVVLGEAVLG